MADYLSREEILRVFGNLTVKNPDDKYQHGMQDAIDCLIPEVINGMESVDTVKHGQWFHINNDSLIYCSECNNEAYWDTDYGQQLFDYCPYCGAKMIKDGEVE